MAYIVCGHGSLKRACRECDYIEDIKELKLKIKWLEIELEAATKTIAIFESLIRSQHDTT